MMRRALTPFLQVFTLAVFVSLFVRSTDAADSKLPAPLKPPTVDSPDAKRPEVRAREFEATELGKVMRMLARDAQINLVIADEVLDYPSTVTLRLEDKTPLEAINIIAQQKELLLVRRPDSTYLLSLRPEKLDEWKRLHAPKDDFSKPGEMGKAVMDFIVSLFGEPVTAAYIKQQERIAEWEAGPQRVSRIARGKKALLDALLAEGFGREEAFKIVLAYQSPSSPIVIPDKK